MTRMFVIMTAGLTLAVCGPAVDPKVAALKTDCAKVVTDLEAVTEFAEIGITAEDFCTCLVATVSAEPEAVQVKLMSGMSAVAAGMTDGVGTDDAVRAIRNAGEGDDASAEARALREDVDLTGDMFGDMLEHMAGNDGACKASSSAQD